MPKYCRNNAYPTIPIIKGQRYLILCIQDFVLSMARYATTTKGSTPVDSLHNNPKEKVITTKGRAILRRRWYDSKNNRKLLNTKKALKRIDRPGILRTASHCTGWIANKRPVQNPILSL